METLRIRDPGWKNSDPGSGINIPDPQHCLFDLCNPVWYSHSVPKSIFLQLFIRFSRLLTHVFYSHPISLWSGLGEEEEESYEDSDQTPLYGKEATVLGYQWAGRG